MCNGNRDLLKENDRGRWLTHTQTSAAVEHANETRHYLSETRLHVRLLISCS